MSTLPQTLFSAKLPPRKPTNLSVRSREYLSASEMEKVLKAARSQGRYGHRNYTLIFLMYRHALRVSEAKALRWEQIDFDEGFMHVRRVKNGLPSTHPLKGTEIRELRRLKRESPKSPYVFVTMRKAPLSSRAIHHIVTEAGRLAQLPFPIHPHMLRHSSGFVLNDKGRELREIQVYMGHANIQNTVIYTQISPKRFNNFWDD